MNREEFAEPFNELVMAFSVQKPNDKAEIYFKKLSKLSSITFLKTCNFAIETCERFPTISRLIEIARTFPDTSDRAQFDCKDCEGGGIVSKWRTAFKCRCLNGERMSKQIPLVPVTQDEKKFWYGPLNKEHFDLYGKDLVEGKAYKGPVDHDLIEKTKAMFGMM